MIISHRNELPPIEPTEVDTGDWEDNYINKGWKREKCVTCSGTGLIGAPGCLPGECRDCNGSGTVWRTPKGRYMDYPGGRFV